MLSNRPPPLTYFHFLTGGHAIGQELKYLHTVLVYYYCTYTHLSFPLSPPQDRLPWSLLSLQRRRSPRLWTRHQEGREGAVASLLLAGDAGGGRRGGGGGGGGPPAGAEEESEDDRGPRWRGRRWGSRRRGVWEEGEEDLVMCALILALWNAQDDTCFCSFSSSASTQTWMRYCPDTSGSWRRRMAEEEKKFELWLLLFFLSKQNPFDITSVQDSRMTCRPKLFPPGIWHFLGEGMRLRKRLAQHHFTHH